MKVPRAARSLFGQTAERIVCWRPAVCFCFKQHTNLFFLSSKPSFLNIQSGAEDLPLKPFEHRAEKIPNAAKFRPGGSASSKQRLFGWEPSQVLFQKKTTRNHFNYHPNKAFPEDAMFINIYRLCFSPASRKRIFGRSVSCCELPPCCRFVHTGKKRDSRWLWLAGDSAVQRQKQTQTGLVLENLLKIWHQATNQTNTTRTERHEKNPNERTAAAAAGISATEVSAHRGEKLFHDYLHSCLQKIQFPKKLANVMRRQNWTKIICQFFFIWCLIQDPYKPSKMFPTGNKHYAGEKIKLKNNRKISISLHLENVTNLFFQHTRNLNFFIFLTKKEEKNIQHFFP